MKTPRIPLSINRFQLVMGLGITLLALIGCLSLGPDLSIKPWDLGLWRDYLGGQKNLQATIMFSIRFPRLFLALLVGGCLSLAGLIFQNLLRNPLADPYIIGVSGGSGLAAVLIQMGGVHDPLIMTLGAFAGGVGAMVLVERFATWSGSMDRLVLILSGVMLNAFFAALISLLLLMAGQDMPRIFFWLMGSLNLPETSMLGPMGLLAALVAGILFIFSHQWNILALGDSTAYHTGVNPERMKFLALLCASLLTAIAVSLSGMIGFIGMFVPHSVRLIFGGNHRMLIPMSIFAGATTLMISDTIVRVCPLGTEIPVGALTALIGTPFFLWLMVRNRKTVAR